jgi:predicted alpha/beta superfamily hydrolase
VDPATALFPAEVEIRDMPSEKVGEVFRVFVGVPPGQADSESPGSHSGQKYPVIFFLDGNGMFLDGLSMVQWMSRSGGIPTAVVVGIGYPVESFWTTMNLRCRDYTPTVDTGFVEVANRTMWRGMPDAEAATSGGADAFLGFIESELMPMIEEEFGGDPDDTTIVGHSFGGLLASYALVSRPGLFQRYVISSPSLWWDDGHVIALEQELAPTRGDLEARAFFSIGALEAEEIQSRMPESMPAEGRKTMEEFMGYIGPPFMMRRMLAFEHTLAMRGYPGLHTSSIVFEEENHGSVRFAATSRGLRFVFAN